MATQPEAALWPAWRRLVQPMLPPPELERFTFDAVLRPYLDPGRHYHNSRHLASVLEWVERLSSVLHDTLSLGLAAWFHDVVYDSRRRDNEEQSAAMARALLPALRVPQQRISEIERLVLLTKTHATEATDEPGKILVDADLAILGANETAYVSYGRAIRREYDWVEAPAYRRGRAQVLQSFLQRSRIFLTETMFADLENLARKNLTTELRKLAEEET